MVVEIGIKYCGGCNPLIDRARLVAEIGELLGPGFKLVPVPAYSRQEASIIICGCETACAEHPEHSVHENTGHKRVIIGGLEVDRVRTKERDLARIIAGKIRLFHCRTE